MKNILLIGAGIGIYWLLTKKQEVDKRKWLRDYFTQISINLSLANVIVNNFSDADINLLYSVINDYILKQQPVPQTTVTQLNALQTKYNFSFS